MSRASNGRRLVLQKVDLLTVTEKGHPRTQAKVILSFGEQRFVGRSIVPPEDEEMLESVALATLDALKAALTAEDVCFQLKTVAKLKPQFLDDLLIVTIIDSKYDDIDVNLTGACIASEERVIIGVASAVLDATNRLVAFLLDSFELIDE